MIADTQQHTPHTTRRELVESFRQMVLEKTDNGSLIIEFLVSAVNGELEDFKPCHKLEAARLLEKFTGVQAQSLIDGLDLQPATRRERRDGRRADRRISSEIAQIAQERTDNGSTIVEFLVSAMEGNLQDFKPCHRMSASRELLRCVFDFIEEDDDSARPEPVEGPEEEEERLRREEYEAAAPMPSTSACTALCTTRSIHSPASARTGDTTARATSLPMRKSPKSRWKPPATTSSSTTPTSRQPSRHAMRHT